MNDHNVREYKWKLEVKDWLRKRRNIPSHVEGNVMRFFERAFQNTRCPEYAWFGAHPGTLSLVVGGIFLAAIVSSGKEKGIWLLVDNEPPEMKGLEYRPVKSTLASSTPLVWVHAQSLETLETIIKTPMIWESYTEASEKIFNSPKISTRSDETHQKRNKKRLYEFWQCTREELQQYFDTLEEQVKQSQQLSKTERQVRLQNALKKPETFQTTQTTFKRNPDVIAEVLESANGICEMCQHPAPFIRASDGTPYLEVHHKLPLAQGGEDIVENALALCPNCHREAHFGKSIALQ